MVKRILMVLFDIATVILLLWFLCVSSSAAEITASKAVSVDTDSSLLYSIREGSFYYESSWNFGSGRYGIVGSENNYTNIPCIVGVNGYSYIENSGDVILSDYKEDEVDIIVPDVPNGAVALFVHFCGIYQYGWTDISNICLRNGSPLKLPEQFENLMQHSKVASQIKQIATTDYNKTPSHMDMGFPKLLTNDDFSTKISGLPNLYSTLNSISSTQEFDTIVLLSDLLDTNGVELEKNDSIKNIVVFLPRYHRSWLCSFDEKVKNRWNFEIKYCSMLE